MLLTYIVTKVYVNQVGTLDLDEVGALRDILYLDVDRRSGGDLGDSG